MGIVVRRGESTDLCPMKTSRVTIIVAVNDKAVLMDDAFIVVIFIIDTSLVLFVAFHYNMLSQNDIYFIPFTLYYLTF